MGKLKMEELTKIVDGEAAGVEARASAVASADKHLADAKADQARATDAHASADMQMQDASAVVSAVKAEVKAHEQTVRAATRAHVAAVAELQVFQQSTREPFDALRFTTNTNAVEPSVAVEGKDKAVEMETEAAVSIA